MSEGASTPVENPYWKAAISRLSNPEMRDRAWEFYVQRLAQNPKMTDTFSGLILVLEAHGLYMLDLPKALHDAAVTPLEAETARFHETVEESVNRHKQIAQDNLRACEKILQTAETATTAVRVLDDAIRQGWQTVDTAKLAERIQQDMEETLLRPLAQQCRELEAATPAILQASGKLKESARELQNLHSKGVLFILMVACLVVMGGCFFYGWHLLSERYSRKIDLALARIESVEGQNREAFSKLMAMNVPIHVVPVVDGNDKAIPGKFALIMRKADDTRLEDSKSGKEATIFFREKSY